MKAVKENKVYTISEAEQKSYQDRGFDIYSDDGGELIAYGRGKTVAYSEFAELQKENELLKAQLAGADAPATTEAETKDGTEGEATPGKKGKKAGA